MTDRILGNLRPSAKLTFPGRPWLAMPGRLDGGGGRPRFRHAPSVLMADRDVTVAYCNTWRPIRADRLDLPLCPVCVRQLTWHGLWPLDPC